MGAVRSLLCLCAVCSAIQYGHALLPFGAPRIGCGVADGEALRGRPVQDSAGPPQHLHLGLLPGRCAPPAAYIVPAAPARTLASPYLLSCASTRGRAGAVTRLTLYLIACLVVMPPYPLYAGTTGLCSFVLAIARPDVFGGAACMSPSFW